MGAGSLVVMFSIFRHIFLSVGGGCQWVRYDDRVREMARGVIVAHSEI